MQRKDPCVPPPTSYTFSVKGCICTHTHTHCTAGRNSHHRVPPGQNSGTDDGSGLYFSSLNPPHPSHISTTPTPPYLGESAHLVLRQAAAGPPRRGGGVRAVPLQPRPHLQVVHPLPEHAGTEAGGVSAAVRFGKGSAHHPTPTPRCVCFFSLRVSSPVFPKQGDGGPPDGDGPARPVDVPHRERHLGILGEVRVLHRQPQPLVPAAEGKERFLGFFLGFPGSGPDRGGQATHFQRVLNAL